MKVVFTRNAEADLEAIGDWIAEDNPARALTFLAELAKACKAIGRRPRRFALVDRQRDPALRRRVHGNYLIFYEVRLNTVEILHVIHGARDYGRIVFADAEPD